MAADISLILFKDVGFASFSGYTDPRAAAEVVLYFSKKKKNQKIFAELYLQPDFETANLCPKGTSNFKNEKAPIVYRFDKNPCFHVLFVIIAALHCLRILIIKIVKKSLW